jgi:hypothetical protein
MHTPSRKIQEDIEFPKVLTTKQVFGKVRETKQLKHLEMIAATSS